MIAVETTDSREKIVRLIELQVLYNRLHALQQREGDLPKQIDELEYQISAAQQQLQARQAELRRIQEEISRLHMSNETLTDHIQKLEKSLLQLRSDEHVFRIDTEIKEAKLTIEKNKRESRNLTQKAELLRGRLEEEEEQIRHLEEMRREKETRLQGIQQQTADLRAQAEAQIKAYEAEVRALDFRLLQLFERRIRVLRESKAVVPIAEVVTDRGEKRACCGGCYTLISRQLEWEIRNRHSLFLCESCGRFLVDAELFEEVVARLG
jgi:predicted  nucleic acid-binding Zn-ribbon protein